MRLAIADPPYPPMFSTRRDLAAGGERIVSRSRATRWYGEAPRSSSDLAPADFHPDAGRWDSLDEHRRLLLDLLDEYDGWAIATTPDGLGAYAPLPIAARIMAWHKPRALPGAHRIRSHWEPVIVYVPEGRRSRLEGTVPDVLVCNPPQINFAGAKPAEWTRWVLDALGYAPGEDEVVDLFPGSGSVARAIDGLLI